MYKAKPKEKKRGESCPVCGAEMAFKDRVNLWYCPRCKSFY